MRRLMLVQQLAKWGAPESPSCFYYPLSKQQFSSSSICAHSSVSTFYYTSSIVSLAIHTIHVLFTLILYFRYSNFEIDMHYNALQFFTSAMLKLSQ